MNNFAVECKYELKLYLLNSTAKILNLAFILYYFMQAKFWVRLKITGKKTFLVRLHAKYFMNIGKVLILNVEKVKKTQYYAKPP